MRISGVLRWVIIILALLFTWSTAQAQSKPPRQSRSQTAEFIALWERFQQTRDHTERIDIGVRALRIAPRATHWPLTTARAKVIGELWYGLGVAYGDTSETEKAITAYSEAAAAFGRQDHPLDWARAQNNLGLAYWDRSQRSRPDDLERAITAYEAALTIYTRDATPSEWARTQNNLALALRRRVRGDRADNLERA